MAELLERLLASLVLPCEDTSTTPALHLEIKPNPQTVIRSQSLQFPSLLVAFFGFSYLEKRLGVAGEVGDLQWMKKNVFFQLAITDVIQCVVFKEINNSECSSKRPNDL